LNSDCFASGSSDGFLRFWRVTPDRSRIEQFHAMKMEGVINSIKWSSDQRSVVIAIGQENRTGRWIVNKTTRNGIYCIKFAKDLKGIGHYVRELLSIGQNSSYLIALEQITLISPTVEPSVLISD